MNSKEVFEEELQNLHIRKRSTISIEETPSEEAIHITVDELPNQYEDMPALVPDTKDDEEETIEGDPLIAYLQGESMKPKPEEKEPLNQPIQVDSGEISIRAKTSISQNLRSYQCPPNSCRNLVIPEESSGIQWNKIWQEGLLFFSFQCLLFQQNLGIPELRLECSAEFAGMECNRIQLFVCFTPVTKQMTNQTLCDVVSFCQPPPPPHQ